MAQQEWLPLFPLAVVLFPRTELPLHIFEERYKEMIGEAIQGKSEFGVVLATGKGIVNTGCTAVVDNVLQRYPDGRLDIISVGRRRFEILLLNQEKEYLRGAVEYFDDEGEEAAVGDLGRRALKAYSELRRTKGFEDLQEPDKNSPQLSFHLAQCVQDLEFRQQLLITRSEAERLQKLVEYLPGYASRQQRIHHAKAVAPHNGHGHWPQPLE